MSVVSPARRRRTVRALPWVVVVAGLLGVGALAGPPPGDGAPLDPASTGPTGTKALVETVRALGADVTVTAETPGPDDDVVLVLVDDLDDAGRERVSSWVEAGGTLVLTDPSSALSPAEPTGEAGFGILDPELLVGCGLAALERLARVSAPGAVLLDVPDGATGCFPGGARSWLVVAPAGRGTIVVLGGPGAFVNEELDRADNALLAATLLVPTRTERVVVLAPPVPGAGRTSLIELVPTEVKLGLIQLGVAFLLAAAWRARRLGLPVSESIPVPLPASELVAAVGQLTQRSRGRGQAAAVLRDDLRRSLALRFGLPVDAPAPVLAEVLAARGALAGRGAERDLSVEEVASLLDGPTAQDPGAGRAGGAGDVADEASLVDLARALESLRRRVNGG